MECTIARVFVSCLLVLTAKADRLVSWHRLVDTQEGKDTYQELPVLIKGFRIIVDEICGYGKSLWK